MRLTRITTVLLMAISLIISACASPTTIPQQPITTSTPTQPPVSNPPQTPTSTPAYPPPLATTQNNLVEALVTKVIDGDTIEVSLSGKLYRVRYIGIDTPETVDPNRPVQPFGVEASKKNTELVAGKTVRLEKDVSETDKYGRLLRYVYVGNLFINAELVRLGYAQVSTYPPDVKYADLFLQLQREAREVGIGLWATSTTNASPTSPPNVALPLKIISVTSPVKAGSRATLVAETTPGALCSITVYYKSGPSSASGLEAKTAESSGRVSWTWTVGSSTTPGTWRIVVATGSISTETTFIVQ